MTSKKEIFTIDGVEYEMDRFSVADNIWIKDNFDSDKDWNEKLGVDRDPKVIVGTVWQFMSPESRAKFKDHKELADKLPGDLNYLLLLYMKIMRIHSVPYPDFSRFDIEKVTDAEMKVIQAEIEEWRKQYATTESQPESQSPAAA